MVVDTLVEVYRRRVDLHRAEKRLTLQIKALCRRAAKRKENGLPDVADANLIYHSVMGKGEHASKYKIAIVAEKLLEARSGLEKARKATEKELVALVKQLPIYSWIENTPGVAALGAATVIGETGDLSNYPSHRHVWKRMGVAVINGGRQRKVAGPEALEHGYCPPRRSVIWNIGEAIIKCRQSPYRKIYDERKEYELKMAVEQGITVLPSAQIPKDADPERYRSEGHVHNRAKRYMEKILLKDLWREWNGQTKGS